MSGRAGGSLIEVGEDERAVELPDRPSAGGPERDEVEEEAPREPKMRAEREACRPRAGLIATGAALAGAELEEGAEGREEVEAIDAASDWSSGVEGVAEVEEEKAGGGRERAREWMEAMSESLGRTAEEGK